MQAIRRVLQGVDTYADLRRGSLLLTPHIGRAEHANIEAVKQSLDEPLGDNAVQWAWRDVAMLMPIAVLFLLLLMLSLFLLIDSAGSDDDDGANAMAMMGLLRQ